MRPRLLVFDFDGTLGDSFPLFVDTMNAAADRFGFRRIEKGDLPTLRELPPLEVATWLGLRLWKTPAITRFVRAAVAERAAEVRLFAGVEALLDALPALGVRAAIVSTNAEPTVRRILGPRLAASICHYGCGASVFGKRPKLRRALTSAGVAPTEALSVGDELRDLAASRAAGIPFGAVTWGFGGAAALRAASPDVLFERVEEIRAYLEVRG